MTARESIALAMKSFNEESYVCMKETDTNVFGQTVMQQDICWCQLAKGVNADLGLWTTFEEFNMSFTES